MCEGNNGWMDGWMEVCFLAAFALLLLCSGAAFADEMMNDG